MILDSRQRDYPSLGDSDPIRSEFMFVTCVIIDGTVSYQEESLTFSGRNPFFRPRLSSGPRAGRTKTGVPTGGKLATLHHLTLQFELASQ